MPVAATKEFDGHAVRRVALSAAGAARVANGEVAGAVDSLAVVPMIPRLEEELMHSSKQWIDCVVAPGMFTEECAVEVRGRWFFVESRYVQAASRSGPARLEVTIVEDGEGRWAVIPSPDRASVGLGA